MVKTNFTILLPGQVATLLGVPRTDILEWINEGKLAITTTISLSSLIDFLGQNRECVGRLYCEDALPEYNKLRKQIIEEMDKKWPIEQLN